VVQKKRERTVYIYIRGRRKRRSIKRKKKVRVGDRVLKLSLHTLSKTAYFLFLSVPIIFQR